MIVLIIYLTLKCAHFVTSRFLQWSLLVDHTSHITIIIYLPPNTVCTATIATMLQCKWVRSELKFYENLLICDKAWFAFPSSLAWYVDMLWHRIKICKIIINRKCSSLPEMETSVFPSLHSCTNSFFHSLSLSHMKIEILENVQPKH